MQENEPIQIISSHFKMTQRKHFSNSLRSILKDTMVVCIELSVVNKEAENGREFQ